MKCTKFTNALYVFLKCKNCNFCSWETSLRTSRVNSVSPFHNSSREGTYNNTQLMTVRILYRTTRTDNQCLFFA